MSAVGSLLPLPGCVPVRLGGFLGRVWTGLWVRSPRDRGAPMGYHRSPLSVHHWIFPSLALRQPPPHDAGHFSLSHNRCNPNSRNFLGIVGRGWRDGSCEKGGDWNAQRGGEPLAESQAGPRVAAEHLRQEFARHAVGLAEIPLANPPLLEDAPDVLTEIIGRWAVHLAHVSLPNNGNQVPKGPLGLATGVGCLTSGGAVVGWGPRLRITDGLQEIKSTAPPRWSVRSARTDTGLHPPA